MNTYTPDKIRNVALVAHNSAGKTSLTEAMLFVSNAITRLGKVEEGNTTTDFDPEEIKRKISISTAIAPCEWRKNKINIIDTPGYVDFLGEVKAGLYVAESVIVVVCAANGVEVETEKVWAFAEERNLPIVVFINKMNRERADFAKALSSVSETFNVTAVPLTIPIGAEHNFKGVINILKMKAQYVTPDGKLTESEIPAEMKETAEMYREKFIEAVAETEDSLTSKYLEGESLTEAEIHKGLKIGIQRKQFVPVLCGSATQLQGVHPLLDLIVDYLPSPLEAENRIGTNPASNEEIVIKCDPNEPLVCFVFKTFADPYTGKLSLFRVYSGTLKSDSVVYNANKGKEEKISQVFLLRGKQHTPVSEVIAGDIAACAKLTVTTTSDTLCDKTRPVILPPIEYPPSNVIMAVEPKTRGDDERLSTSLTRLAEEDPTLSVERNHETKQTLVRGTGELHLNVVLDKLKTKFDVSADLSIPKVAYRETIRGKTEVQGKYKRQSGGRGQYGDVWIRVEPLPRGGGFEFVDEIFGGAIPAKFIPSVEKGIREAMEEGVLAGYPVTDVKVTLYDGSYHVVDSSDIAFKIAGAMAFRKAMEQANPVLLEPIMEVEVTAPEQYMGDIIADLNSRRGQILGMEHHPEKRGFQLIRALVPLAEMFRYATDLRSIARGRGSYTMKFSHYQETPPEVSQKIIAASKQAKEAEKNK